MVKTETITAVKVALRIKHNALDSEISADVEACLKDLETVGIIAPDETDPLILHAIKLYCRTAYTDDATQATRFQNAYDSLKSTLMVAEGYGGGYGGEASA